jgi:hypothetical protein
MRVIVPAALACLVELQEIGQVNTTRLSIRTMIPHPHHHSTQQDFDTAQAKETALIYQTNPPKLI